MNGNLTEIVCVVDKSGSMQARTNDVIGGFNTFLDEQKKLPGEAILTLSLFDTDYRLIHNGVGISSVPALNDQTYMAGGWTALLDAVGRTIDDVGQRLHTTQENNRPGKVIFLIITDGEENSSREYKLEQVKELIKRQQDMYKWDFVFLGANQDAFLGAQSMGIPTANAVRFSSASGQSVMDTYRGLSACVGSYRSTGQVSTNNTAWNNMDTK